MRVLAAVSALQRGLACILDPGLGLLRPINRLFYRWRRSGIRWWWDNFAAVKSRIQAAALGLRRPRNWAAGWV